MKLNRNALESINGLDLNEKIVVVENSGSDPFTEVSEKAFLSCKNIQELTLPETIVSVGKWAFAHMRELRSLTIPASEIALAKDAFLDCPKLTEIHINKDNSCNEGLPLFFATLVGTLKAYSGVDVTDSSFNTLFTPNLAAGTDTHYEWMQLYDKVLTDFVNKSDSDGFTLELLGWFNVESEESQRDKYEHQRRIDKITLSFMRLKYDLHLNDTNREILHSYLRECMNSNSRNEIWEILTSDLGKDIDNIKILSSSGDLSDNNRIKLVKLLNENNGNPEVISYLLSLNKADTSANIFDSLDL